jgi:hypothetical protein
MVNENTSYAIVMLSCEQDFDSNELVRFNILVNYVDTAYENLVLAKGRYKENGAWKKQ